MHTHLIYFYIHKEDIPVFFFGLSVLACVFST